ncbi:MAG: DUF4364 family protein [Oscillospiraceae bacterium]|jgi:hypothetical protein
MEQTDRFGFIHEKLDIKLLILFVLSRLPKPVSFDALTELVMVDDGFDYFEYTQCLDELVRSGNVERDGSSYKISRMGSVNEDTVESSIPYSVRLKAENKARPLIEKMKRDALIGTSHERAKNGGCNVRLSLSDGLGEIVTMSVLVADEAQAQKIEANFRENAEQIYQKLVALLSEEPQENSADPPQTGI